MKVGYERTHESKITMLEPLLTFLRKEIFKAAISASTFFAFLTRPRNLFGSSSKLKNSRQPFIVKKMQKGYKLKG